MKSSELPEIPDLPLSKAERIEGVLKLSREQKTRIGAAFAEIRQFQIELTDDQTFAEEMLMYAQGSALTFNNGNVELFSGSGFPVSCDQLIELDALMQALPTTDLQEVIKVRTFSFATKTSHAVLGFLNAAMNMHVYLVPTLIRFRPEQEGELSTAGMYEVEFVTNSKISVLYQVMTNSWLGAPFSDWDQTLRACPAAANSYEFDEEARERNIKAEGAEIRKAISEATVKKILSGMSTYEGTVAGEPSVEGAL